jgi:ATP-dependent RNA helicase MSS116
MFNFCLEQFRDAKKAILFSSDVTARGMDYPDVTFVLQIGNNYIIFMN